MQPLGRILLIKVRDITILKVKRLNLSMAQDGTGMDRVTTKPPPSGYLSYMLDGNAVMDRNAETLLKQLADHSPPVIGGGGYQTNLPF